MNNPLIRRGDLIFFSGQRWWSRLIKARTDSNWSHVGIVCTPSRIAENFTIVESIEGRGVRITTLSEWKRWNGKVAVGRITVPYDRNLVIRFALGQVGAKYASPRQFIRSFSLFWSKVSRFIGLSSDEDPSRWFCSELAAAALISGGIELQEDPAKISPGDLAKLSFVKITDTYKV